MVVPNFDECGENLTLKVEAHGIMGRVSGWIRDWLK